MSDGQGTPMPAPGAWCHIEIAADDVAKVREFYGNCFGWTFQHVPEMDYTLYQTGRGGIGGGIMKRKPEMPRQHMNFVSVADLDASAAKVAKEGGRIVVPRQEVPGAGSFGICSDPEGNAFGMWEGAGSVG